MFSGGRIVENLAIFSLISGSSVRKLRQCSFCAAENSSCSSLRSSRTLDSRAKWRSSSDQSVSSSISSSGPYGDPAPGASTYLMGIIWRGVVKSCGLFLGSLTGVLGEPFGFGLGGSSCPSHPLFCPGSGEGVGTLCKLYA